ncbi:PREDICTED: uncharacterized protein LOC108773802 [Cyphomyrmex costatus]|uniref:uncharacterized protein LOC108773802 n=1 Tax=Cyphomyrmex costatus TaxID=456900 RepID=UPI0008522BA9|nr:PREDICTED: uncharacterized protein LOC108773802 [Cyphomyrmex costatus]
MGRSKFKKKIRQGKSTIKITEESTNTKVPIYNLPEKFLWMHVKGGTKIRNVLGYALKEFSNYNSIVWTGTGNGIAKTISCAEIFKRKYEGLHQVTKLCYVSSEKSKEDVAKTHRIPEIHILLTKDIKDITELGYQAPEDSGKCLTMRNESAAESKTMTTTESTDDTKMDTTIESTSVGKMDTTESTGDAKMDTTTKSTSDVPCIDEQSRTMKKNKKNKRNKTTKNSYDKKIMCSQMREDITFIS